MNRWVSLLAAAALLSTGAAADVSTVAPAPRFSIPLDGEWRFTLGDGTDEWAGRGFDESSWERVRLPHTWNAFDGQDGGGDYRRGAGWYRTRVHLRRKRQAAGFFWSAMGQAGRPMCSSTVERRARTLVRLRGSASTSPISCR